MTHSVSDTAERLTAEEEFAFCTAIDWALRNMEVTTTTEGPLARQIDRFRVHVQVTLRRTTDLPDGTPLALTAGVYFIPGAPHQDQLMNVLERCKVRLTNLATEAQKEVAFRSGQAHIAVDQGKWAALSLALVQPVPIVVSEFMLVEALRELVGLQTRSIRHRQVEQGSLGSILQYTPGEERLRDFVRETLAQLTAVPRQ